MDVLSRVVVVPMDEVVLVPKDVVDVEEEDGDVPVVDVQLGT